MKKILFIFLSIFLFLPNVSAVTTPYYGYEIQHFNDGTFYDCLTSTTCEGSLSTIAQWGLDSAGTQYPGFLSGSAKTPAYTLDNAYGVMFLSTLPDQSFNKNYLYAFNLYVCSTGTSTTYPLNIYLGSGSSIRSYKYPVNIHSKNSYALGSLPYDYYGNADTGGVPDDYSCSYQSYLLNPTITSDAFGVRFTTKATQTARYWVIGYTFDNLGYVNNLSTSDIETVIDNSGLATASDIDSVNDSISEVKSEISAMQEEQALTNEKLDETNDQLNDLNDNITDSDSSGATDSADSFFSDFNTDTYGLTAIITAPLNFINSITSSTCSPIQVPLPFVDTSLTLPCFNEIYSRYFGGFFTIYQTITFGVVAYWVCVRIFNLVKDFKNPDHDEIEVMDL